MGRAACLVPLWAAAVLPLAFWPPFEDAFKLPQFTVACALAAWCVAVLLRRPFPVLNGRTAAPLALLAGTAAAGLFGKFPRPGDAVLSASLIVSSVLLATGPGFAAGRSAGRLAVAACLAGALSSLYSVIQFAGLDLIPSPGGAVSRPFSTMGNPDFLAAYLVAVLPLTVVAWMGRGSGWAAAGALAMGAALLLTQSRGAWLGAAAAALAAAPLVRLAGRPLRASRGLLVALALAAAGTAGFFAVHGQARARLGAMFSTGHFDAAGRLFMWRATMEMVRERPLAGVGPGGYGMAYPAMHARLAARGPGMPYFFTENAHNDFLQLPAELGVPVFGLMIWVWAVFVRLAWRRIRDGDDVALGTLLGFIALEADAAFNFPWYLVPTQAWFWLSFALLTRRSRAGALSGAAIARPAASRAAAAWGLAAFAGAVLCCRQLAADAWLKLAGDFNGASRWSEGLACAKRSGILWLGWEGRARVANAFNSPGTRHARGVEPARAGAGAGGEAGGGAGGVRAGARAQSAAGGSVARAGERGVSGEEAEGGGGVLGARHRSGPPPPRRSREPGRIEAAPRQGGEIRRVRRGRRGFRRSGR